MSRIHNFIGEQIIKYIFRHGGMITVHRKAGAVQVAKVYSKAAYENVIVPAFQSYTHQNTMTNFGACCESMEAMAQIIDIAKIGWTKDQIMEWLQSEVEE